MITLKFNANKAFRRILAYQKAIQSAAEVTANDVLMLGKRTAQQYAPKDSWQTFKAIEMRKKRAGNESFGGMVYVRELYRAEEIGRTNDKLSTRDVARLLADPQFTIGNRRIPEGWIQSGSRNFMMIAQNQMRNQVKKRFKDAIKFKARA